MPEKNVLTAPVGKTYKKSILLVGSLLFIILIIRIFWMEDEENTVFIKSDVKKLLLSQQTGNKHYKNRNNNIGVVGFDDEWLDIISDPYTVARIWSENWSHKWKPRKRLTKVLFWETLENYRNGMDRYLFDWMEGAMKHPNLEVTLWGPNHTAWNSDLSPTENLDKKFGCNHFDLVIVVAIAKEDVPQPCGKSILLNEVGDCHRGRCLKQFLPAEIQSFRYAFIPMELFDVRHPRFPGLNENGNERIFAHNPDCANDDIMKPIEWDRKTLGAILVGRPREDLYPLRYKIGWGIDKRIIDARGYRHPGYVLFKNNSEEAVPDPPLDLPYSRENADLAKIVRFQEKYASSLKRAQICMFDSSIVRKAVRKFMEALMVGCVPAADLPFEMEEIFREVVIPLSVDMTAGEINEVITKALQDPLDLQKRAAKGLILARKHFSCQKKTERALFLMDEYRNGFRGYYFPYGYRLGCHSYMTPLENVNPWC